MGAVDRWSLCEDYGKTSLLAWHLLGNDDSRYVPGDSSAVAGDV